MGPPDKADMVGRILFFFFLFFIMGFFFFLLYNIVWVLPYINVHPPRGNSLLDSVGEGGGG